MTSPEIARIVAEVYSRHLTLPSDWTPGQRQGFLDQTAASLSRQIAELAAELGERAVDQWTADHGTQPDYLTKVGLLNSAAASAKEIVLSEQLYELIPPPQETEEPPRTLVSRDDVPWTQRWTQTQYRTDPDEATEDLVAQLWPSPAFSAVFRIKAGYLLAARAEDRLPPPQKPGDPLAVELTELVYQDLRDDGLPAR